MITVLKLITITVNNKIVIEEPISVLINLFEALVLIIIIINSKKINVNRKVILSIHFTVDIYLQEFTAIFPIHLFKFQQVAVLLQEADKDMKFSNSMFWDQSRKRLVVYQLQNKYPRSQAFYLPANDVVCDYVTVTTNDSAFRETHDSQWNLERGTVMLF